MDVLIQARKTSRYVNDQLLPALRAAGLNVVVQDGWVDDLVVFSINPRSISMTRLSIGAVVV